MHITFTVLAMSLAYVIAADWFVSTMRLTAADTESEFPSKLLALGLSSAFLLYIGSYVSNYGVDIRFIDQSVPRMQDFSNGSMVFGALTTLAGYILLGFLLVDSSEENGLVDVYDGDMKLQLWLITAALFTGHMHIIGARFIDPTVNFSHVPKMARRRVGDVMRDRMDLSNMLCCRRMRAFVDENKSARAEKGSGAERSAMVGRSLSRFTKEEAVELKAGGNIVSIHLGTFNGMQIQVPAFVVHNMGVVVFLAASTWLAFLLADDHTIYARMALIFSLFAFGFSAFFATLVANDTDSLTLEDVLNRPVVHIIRNVVVLGMYLCFPVFLSVLETIKTP